MGNDKCKVDLNKVVDSGGNLITEGKENVLDVWMSHFNELLNYQGEHKNIRDAEVDVTVVVGNSMS